MPRPAPVQQLTDGCGSDVGEIGDRQQLVRGGVSGSQDVEALPPGRCFDKAALYAPEHAQKRGKHKVRGIDEKDGALTRPCFGYARLQAFFLNVSWAATSALAGILPTFSGFIPSECKNWRTWVGFRAIPVRASIRAAASITVAGGCC
jgi:hypothetical protein